MHYYLLESYYLFTRLLFSLSLKVLLIRMHFLILCGPICVVSAANRRSVEMSSPPKSISDAELAKKKNVKKTKSGIKVRRMCFIWDTNIQWINSRITTTIFFGAHSF